MKTTSHDIRTVATGRRFGHFAMVTANRRLVWKSDTYATPTAAYEAAKLWLKKRETANQPSDGDGQ